MRQKSYLLLMLLFGFFMICTKVYAQESHGSAIIAGVSYGVFEARKSMLDIYGKNIPSYYAHAAFGYRSSFLIAKYRILKVTGKSRLQNYSASTKAEWNEAIACAGFRQYTDNLFFYIDVLYVNVKADESISTESPVIPELASSNSIQDHGIGCAIGIAPRLIGPLGIFVEAEWNYMLQNDNDNFGNKIPNLGGVFISGGIQLIID